MSLLNPLIKLNLLPAWRREVIVGGNRFLAVSLDRLLNLYLHRVGLTGRAEEAFLRRVVRRGMNVVDVGANQGIYTLLLASLVGESGSVLAFEPEFELFDALSRNCRMNSNGNVMLYNLALGSSSGTVTLSRSLLNAGDNRLAAGHNPDHSRTIPVQMTTLDEILAGRPVDFIKIDVQGWEWEVFRGMKDIMKSNRPLSLFFEYWPYGLTNAGCDPTAILTYLRDHDFSLYRCEGPTMRGLGDIHAFTQSLRGRRYTNLYAARGSAIRRGEPETERRQLS